MFCSTSQLAVLRELTRCTSTTVLPSQLRGEAGASMSSSPQSTPLCRFESKGERCFAVFSREVIASYTRQPAVLISVTPFYVLCVMMRAEDAGSVSQGAPSALTSRSHTSTAMLAGAESPKLRPVRRQAPRVPSRIAMKTSPAPAPEISKPKSPNGKSANVLCGVVGVAAGMCLIHWLLWLNYDVITVLRWFW